MIRIRSMTWMFLLLVPPAQAVTLQYVTNEFTVELRTGRDHNDPVVHTLTPGTRVSLLRNTPDGHSRVRLEDGTEGWIPSQLLVKDAIPEQRLLRLRTKQDEIAAANQRGRRDQLALRHALADLQSRLVATRTAHQQLVSTIARLRDLIPRDQALEEQHRSLLSQLATLESDLELLRVETHARRDDASRNWAIVGIGVLLGGVLAGLLLNRTLS